MAFFRDPEATASNIAFWLADAVSSLPEFGDVIDSDERSGEYARLYEVEHIPDDPIPLEEWFSFLPLIERVQIEADVVGRDSVWLDGNTRLVRAYFRIRVVRPATGVAWSTQEDTSIRLRSLWTGQLESYDAIKAATSDYELVELVWISSWRIARMTELFLSFERWARKLSTEASANAAFGVALRVYFGELSV